MAPDDGATYEEALAKCDPELVAAIQAHVRARDTFSSIRAIVGKRLSPEEIVWTLVVALFPLMHEPGGRAKVQAMANDVSRGVDEAFEPPRRRGNLSALARVGARVVRLKCSGWWSQSVSKSRAPGSVPPG